MIIQFWYVIFPLFIHLKINTTLQKNVAGIKQVFHFLLVYDRTVNNVHIDCGAHPASYSKALTSSPMGVRWQGHEAHDSIPFSAKDRNCGTIPPTSPPPHVFMVKDNFSFTIEKKNLYLLNLNPPASPTYL
jgi:hypothetical protein